MKDKNQNLFYQKPVGRQYIQTGILSTILILIISFMIWNTSELQKVLEKSTQQYVEDVSYQLANDISSRFGSLELALAQLADSIPRLSGDNSIHEFLERKARILDFDALMVIGKNGISNPDGFHLSSPLDLTGIQKSFQGETTVTYLEGQNLLFTAPIYENGRVEEVLAGVRNKYNVQALIQPKSFKEEGLTCIIDEKGEVVISPTDLKPFLQLDTLFKNGTDKQTSDFIRKMQKDIAYDKSGIFSFTAVDDTKLVMSYRSLGVNNWFLLTLVPSDLISRETSTYIFRTFAIVGGIFIIFALFLLTLIHSYKTNRKQLENIAFVDPMTGGVNHAAFQLEYQKLAQSMVPMTYTIVLLNVRGFKLINENFGIAMGNETLKYIYTIIQRHMHPDELFARGDADNFFLCLRENSQGKIQLRLDDILTDINSFSHYADIQYQLSMSQGACLIDDPRLDLTLIEDRARTACKLHRERSKCSFYSSELTQKMKNEQELNALFDASIKNHDFQVYLQPKVRLSDVTPGGAEALVRWIHPQRGVIFPSDFIPLFEKSGNICSLDLYVFEEVCLLLRKWMDTGKTLLPVSVNLSRTHFKNLNFLRSFSSLKEKYQIPDGVIELELTESVFFDEQQRILVQNSIREMHKHGFLCSLDDFGVGFSSLALLKEFDVDTIKLDRQFFMDISNPRAQNVIASFIALADKLGVGTVAEGIETQEQLDYLSEAGCNMVQGYIFSKPLPIPEFESWEKTFLC